MRAARFFAKPEGTGAWSEMADREGVDRLAGIERPHVVGNDWSTREPYRIEAEHNSTVHVAENRVQGVKAGLFAE